MDWDKVKIEYDPTLKGSAGLWRCPYCQNRFFGGGPALHALGCIKKVDYDEMVLAIGPDVATDMKVSVSNGFAAFTIDGLTMDTLSKTEVGKLLGL